MDPTNQLQLVVYVPQEVCPQELSSTTSIVLGVPPLSAYEIDLMKPFVKDLELQINVSNKSNRAQFGFFHSVYIYNLNTLIFS